ncbi:MAG TPA: hypothetical protein VKB79_00870 [Bryobacteraceae bacterium]|nr:hypothetical protein [Bryobacteraceae bacterium]
MTPALTPKRPSGGLAGLIAFAERRAGAIVTVYSAFYLIALARFSAVRPLWLDEIASYYVSGVWPPGAIMRAIEKNADGQPLLFHLITREFHYGRNQMLFRLPEIMGVLVMSLCLYVFVSKIASRIHGLLAMTLPMITNARSYSYEARPYALILCFGACMMVCWQAANRNRHRVWAIAGLWIFSCLSVAIHYFGLLSLLPFLGAEAVKWRARRKIDWPIIAALSSSLLVILPSLPVINAVRAMRIIPLYHIALPGSFIEVYDFLLGPALLPSIEALIAALIFLAWRGQSADRFTPADREQPWEGAADTALACGFLVLPFAGLMLGKAVNTFMFRYTLAATLGFCIAVPIALRRSREVTLVCLLVTGLNVSLFLTLRIVKTPDGPKQTPRAALQSATGGLPIVFTGAHEYVETHFYAPADIAPRLYYLSSPELARYWAGTDAVDAMLKHWSEISDCQIDDPRAFTASHKRFIVVSKKTDAFPWLLQELEREGARISLRDTDGSQAVYDVEVRN